MTLEPGEFVLRKFPIAWKGIALEVQLVQDAQNRLTLVFGPVPAALAADLMAAGMVGQRIVGLLMKGGMG